MEVEFVAILNDIESSNYDPETKGKLQSATMLLWQLRDLQNGGTGIVSWNGMTTSPISTDVLPKPEEPKPEEPKPEEPKPEEPKPEELKPQEPKQKERKAKKPTLDLKKDLGINLDDINLDDITSGF